MVLKRTGFFRVIAASMVVVLVGFSATMASGVGAAVNGTVMAGTDKLPLEGATVHLSSATGQLVSSVATGADGNFRIETIEAATYEVAVEYDGGLYLVASAVRVDAGQPLTLNLAIEKSKSAALGVPQARRGSGGLLASPLAATLLVAGSAITVGALIESATSDDKDPVASEFLTR